MTAIAASADGANLPSPTPSGNGAVKTAKHDEQRRRSRSKRVA
jgi:hypothetical protein